MLEKFLALNGEFEKYSRYKTELEIIFFRKVKIAGGVKTHSKCNWHDHGKKSSKFFLSLQKQKVAIGLIQE